MHVLEIRQLGGYKFGIKGKLAHSPNKRFSNYMFTFIRTRQIKRSSWQRVLKVKGAEDITDILNTSFAHLLYNDQEIKNYE